MKKKHPNWILTILVLINLALYLPALFEPISYGDECIYLVLGHAFRKGLVFYRDIHDNKPPLLYLIAALSNNSLFVFRLIALFWQLIGLGLIYQLIRKLTNNQLGALIGGIIFTLGYLIFEGKVANGEIFMMTPVIAAVFLLLSRLKEKGFSFGLIIGLLFAFGFLFKVPVFFDFLGFLFAVYFLPLTSIKLKSLIKPFREPRFYGLAFGFILPISISIIYYSFKGAFTPYVRSALLQNIGYLSSWQGSSSGLALRGIILIILSGIIFLLRKKFSYPILFSATWFVFALFGALLSARPYPHYLIETIPPLALLFGLAWQEKSKLTIIMPITSLLLLAFSYQYFHFWWYPIFPNYQKLIAYSLNQISQEKYLSYWGERTIRNYQLARFLRETTHPEDRVFVWGDAACVYAIAKRLPPGRYTVNYHIFDFNGFAETLEAIKKTKPPIIVKMDNETRIWPEFELLLERQYRLLFRKDLADQVYLRINQ